jgi:hypothetical protein
VLAAVLVNFTIRLARVREIDLRTRTTPASRSPLARWSATISPVRGDQKQPRSMASLWCSAIAPASGTARRGVPRPRARPRHPKLLIGRSDTDMPARQHSHRPAATRS